MEYRRWKAHELRAHFRSDNPQVYLPKVRGKIAYAQLVAEYNPALVWDEDARRVEGEVWSEVGDAVARGRTWFSHQNSIPIFMKRTNSETGFIGPVCYCRPLYYAERSDYREGVDLRDAKLKARLPVGHPGRRDIGAYLVLEYKGSVLPK